jgi:predicted SAM-dependent methyltransferase
MENLNHEPIAIDLGCGDKKRPGAIGVDIVALPGVDIVATLDSIPLDDNFADIVYASHILEHVDSLVIVMEEVWRVLKPGGRVHVWSPHFSCPMYVWADPTHQRAFSSSTFDYWDPDSHMNYYSSSRFKVRKRQLHLQFERKWNSSSESPDFRLFRKVFTRTIEPLANFNRFTQLLCERTWGTWIGFEEIYLELECIKEK